ncbi:hypothetical protein D3C73_920110 [compost metagenome]
MTECLPYLAEDDQIDGRQNQQERSRNGRTDHAPNILQPCHMMFKHAGSEGDANTCQYHNGGMSERKPCPGGQCALFLLHQFAGCAVDGGDMIGIHGVA